MSLKALHTVRFLLLLAVGLPFPAQAATEAKCYKDLVCDRATLFKEEQFEALSLYHEALLKRYDMDYRVIVIPNVGDIALQAVKTFKAADIGSRSKTRKGLLLLIDPAQDKVRLEISAGLDAVFTDGFVAYLQQRQMIPFFQSNRVSDGILATTEMIVTRAQEAAEGKEFIPPAQLPENLAIGAGAQTKASIGTGYQAPAPARPRNPKPSGLTPEQVVAAYHQTLADRDASPDLEIYTRETRELKRKWVVTPAQMANELNAYKKCDLDQTVYVGENALAVVRYKVDQRQCAPYFLVVEDGAWRLDFVTMMENIRFNISNDWHLDLDKPLPYADAFLDWSFNKDGYPFPLRKLRWGINVNTNYRTRITTVHKIFPDTPAASMGLREGDIILSWDGIQNPNHKQVSAHMNNVSAGKIVVVEILRDGQPLKLELKAPPEI